MKSSNLDIRIFSNKIPKRKIKREFYAITNISVIFISTIFACTYIINKPTEPLEFPTINIICKEESNTDNLVECKFELVSKDESECVGPIKAQIKISGGKFGASSYPKKPYRLKLSEDHALLGMRKEDDWNLNSLYLDYPRMRIKIASELYRALESINPTAVNTNSEFVCLNFNGEFQGLYLLTERYNRRFFGLDDAQNNYNSSLIFQAKSSASFRESKMNRNWEQDWPNEYDGIFIMDSILDNISRFITETSNEVFFDSANGIFTKFDYVNLIDFYIFNFFIDHGDFWCKNYYLIRNTYPSRFILVPSDYDGCLGQYGWNLYDADANPEEFIRKNNRLFERLLNNAVFMNDCKKRWNFLREELWTEEFIMDLITKIQKDINEISKIDAHIWDPAIIVYLNEEWKNNIDEYLKNLVEYIPKRLEFCDIYFEKI